jgi:thymidylate kinase
MRLGAVVVFEGLDRAGKSTQLDRLSALSWSHPRPTFAHMPSGLTSLTSRIYALTEGVPISSPLARQLLHLACHAENMAELVAGRDRSGLVLDRWWWSTMAYGWHAHGQALGIDASTFRRLIEAVWS